MPPCRSQIKIVENAKRIAAKQDGDLKQDEKELQGQFTQLLDLLRPEGQYEGVEKEHAERIKKVRAASPRPGRAPRESIPGGHVRPRGWGHARAAAVHLEHLEQAS